MVKKLIKKVKKGLGSLANKVADKLIPKELAPFLPALAPLFMGPAAGTIQRFLIPQLLTALSTGKTEGDIDLTSQALTGLASFLSSPERMELASDPKLETTQLQPGDVGFQDPAQKIYVGPGDPQFEAGTGFYKDDPFNINRTIDAEGNILELPGDIKRSGVANVPDPNFIITETTPEVTGFDKFTDTLKGGVNTARDFIQGTNLAEDAGFLKNLPRRAVMQGILAAGPMMSQIRNYNEQLEEEEAERLAQMGEFNDARTELFDYFRRLSDPTGMFAATGGRVGAQEGGIMSAAPGMPQGMQVDGRNGTFIPMGVKEKADDVPAMLSKNEFVMTADAVRAMGDGDVNQGAQRMYDLMNSLEARV